MPDGRHIGPCYRCKSEIWLPQALYDACKHSSKISFFCSYGHEQVFAEGETEAQILRRERDRLKQQIAEKDDAIKRREQERDAALLEIGTIKKAITKARKRTIAGTCPCCHRTFRQMALHIKSKHPGFKAEEAA